MPTFPLNRYRPTKTSDGQGGFTEALGVALVVFGSMQVHENKTTLLVDSYEDVLVADQIGVQEESTSTEALYRVVNSERMLGTRWRRLTLERIERPIST
jgi:hypothetical protein